MVQFNYKKCGFISLAFFIFAVIIFSVIFISRNQVTNNSNNQTKPISQVSTNLNSGLDPNLTNELTIRTDLKISDLKNQIVFLNKAVTDLESQIKLMKDIIFSNNKFNVSKVILNSNFKVDTLNFPSKQSRIYNDIITDDGYINICIDNYKEKRTMSINVQKTGNYIFQGKYKCQGTNDEFNGGSMNIWKVNDKVVKKTSSIISECDFSSSKKGSEIKVTQPISLFLNVNDKITFSVYGKYLTSYGVSPTKYKCLGIIGTVFYYED